MYVFNLCYFDVIKDGFINDDILTWGAIYNYDQNNTTKNHWQYTGSFGWINPQKLFKYIKDNKVDLSIYNIPNKQKFCAEEFFSNTFDPKYAGFLNHKKYNKYFSHFLYENSNLPYNNIAWVGFELTDYDSYNYFYDYFNKYIIQ